MAKTFIGCSGYLYPHWRGGVFYPSFLKQKDEFSYYASFFNTVELNSTFYRQPPKNVWESWSKKAPENFVYAVKVNRFLTHIKKLSDIKESWDYFYQSAQTLSSHLGPFLFQLPPSLTKNTTKLKNLVPVLPKKEKIAFEFRHLSWFSDDVYQILKENNWGLVVVSHPTLPFIPQATANFVYFRLHGKETLFNYFYDDKELTFFAKQIFEWLKRDLDVYVYFNNDTDGFAPKNALTLKSILGKML